MRVIGRLLLVLAIALPATWIVAVGVASGDSGFGPAVLYCNHWDDDMRLSPGATQNPTNQSVSAHGKLFRCNKAGGGATFVTGDGWGIYLQVDWRRMFTDETKDLQSGRNDVLAVFGIRMILD